MEDTGYLILDTGLRTMGGGLRVMSRGLMLSAGNRFIIAKLLFYT